MNSFDDAIKLMMLSFFSADVANYTQGEVMLGIPVKKSKINMHSIKKAEKIGFFKEIIERIADK